MKDTIKRDIISAMKRKDNVARDILKVLKGEIERKEDSKTQLSDVEILRLVKKLIEGVIETDSDNGEIAVLDAYLPKQMTKDEIAEEAASYITRESLDSPREMGKVMGYFKQNFDGTYDGKELSQIVKQLLA